MPRQSLGPPDRSPVLTGTCPGTLPLSVNAAGEEQP